MSDKSKITTNAGCPVGKGQYENSQTVGSRGPVLLQDFFLHEKMAQFNRERIPERIVHAKGVAPLVNLLLPMILPNILERKFSLK